MAVLTATGTITGKMVSHAPVRGIPMTASRRAVILERRGSRRFSS
jgi:hypothetical protein